MHWTHAARAPPTHRVHVGWIRCKFRWCGFVTKGEPTTKHRGYGQLKLLAEIGGARRGHSRSVLFQTAQTPIQRGGSMDTYSPQPTPHDTPGPTYSINPKEKESPPINYVKE